MNEALLLLFLFAIKHGVCDLALQAIYCRPSHKHIFLSPRAMMHSLHHGVGAWIVLIPFTNYLTAITLAILDGVSHHIIDYTKEKDLKKLLRIVDTLPLKDIDGKEQTKEKADTTL